MARLSSRVRRLAAKLRGRHAGFRKAQLAAMTDEELEAEMVKLAVNHGYLGDPTRLTFATANAWLEEQIQATLAELPDAERDHLLARHPRLGCP